MNRVWLNHVMSVLLASAKSRMQGDAESCKGYPWVTVAWFRKSNVYWICAYYFALLHLIARFDASNLPLHPCLVLDSVPHITLSGKRLLPTEQVIILSSQQLCLTEAYPTVYRVQSDTKKSALMFYSEQCVNFSDNSIWKNHIYQFVGCSCILKGRSTSHGFLTKRASLPTRDCYFSPILRDSHSTFTCHLFILRIHR